MTILSSVTNAVWQYISPAKNASKAIHDSDSARTRTAISPSLSTLKRRRSMSPASRVNSWHLESQESTSQSRAGPEKRIKAVKTIEMASAVRSDETATGLDIDMNLDDTLVTSPTTDDLSAQLYGVHVDHQPKTPVRKTFRSPSWSDHDAQDETLLQSGDITMSGGHPLTPPDSPATPPDSPARTSAPNASATTTSAQVATTDLSAYAMAVRPLVSRLLSRGREPILPSHWNIDFRFLPSSLFHSSPTAPATICALTGSDFRAQKAFRDLLQLGAHVRDRIMLHLSPEITARNGTAQYLDWATKDAGPALVNMPSLMAIHSGNKHTDPAEIQRGLAAKMLALGRTWSAHLAPAESSDHAVEELPTIYGLAISHSLMAFVSWTPTAPLRPPARASPVSMVGRACKVEEGIAVVRDECDVVMRDMQSIGMFDFGARELDVWNALAVALLIVHVRDQMRGFTRL